jgi:hypothetical protein
MSGCRRFQPVCAASGTAISGRTMPPISLPSPSTAETSEPKGLPGVGGSALQSSRRGRGLWRGYRAAGIRAKAGARRAGGTAVPSATRGWRLGGGSMPSTTQRSRLTRQARSNTA